MLRMAFATGSLLTLSMLCTTAIAQSPTGRLNPGEGYRVTTAPAVGGDALTVATRIEGTQPGSTGIGQDAPRSTTSGTGGAETVGVSGSALTYGPCSFVEGAGQNWWQSAVNQYSYGLVPCAPAGDTPALPFARELLQRLPLPQLRIQASPNPGLVAVPARFWVDDYQGQPIGNTGTLELPPLVGPSVPVAAPPAGYPADCPCRQPRTFSVEVQAWPLGYRWTFGDGRPDGHSPGQALVTGSLGYPPAPGDPRRAPQAGEVAHSYEFASFYTGGGFPVEVEAAFAAAFRVDGGEWQRLDDTVARRSVLRHRVLEIQTVLVSVDPAWVNPGR